MDDGVQQKALRIYQDVALLAFDLLSRIKAGRVDREPPCMGFMMSSVICNFIKATVDCRTRSGSASLL